MKNIKKINMHITLYHFFVVQYFFRIVLNVMVYFRIVKLNDNYDNILDLHR